MPDSRLGCMMTPLAKGSVSHIHLSSVNTPLVYEPRYNCGPELSRDLQNFLVMQGEVARALVRMKLMSTHSTGADAPGERTGSESCG